MATLERNLRRDLEKAVRKARRVAESGARKVLEQLGVNHHEPYGSMTSEQRALRNRLRVHGRQLGDSRDRQKGTQSMGRLIQECGYEHWHRMLFARFLADADLLIEPQSGVSITLAECQELARGAGTDWLVLASDYAERMLPQIFHKDNPVLDIGLPPETRSDLEDLLKALPRDVFTADDSLGWVYQFWQAERKDEVNRSETKIGADELPVVTQLFTEDYMVLFLLHNTLGAWWAGKVLEKHPDLATTAESENELRDACKVGEVEWSYLRFVREKDQDGSDKPWRPAAGTFEGWPKAAKDITLLDPCMGSGHFLVFALPILTAFRKAEEGLNETAAVEAVLRDNLFGLEIDQRCTQIAAFNLAFASWRKIGHRPLPQLNLACSGLAIGVTKAEWLKLAERAVMAADPEARRDLFGVEKNLFTVGLEARVKNGIEALYDLFAKAPWLGSLIDPQRADADIFHEGFDKLEPLLASILLAADTDDVREMAVAARGMAKALDILGRKVTLVATNVPYLGRPKQGRILQEYSEKHYSLSKADLATCFIERFTSFSHERARTFAAVTPHAWLNLTRYGGMRKKLLARKKWHFTMRLGSRAFDTIGGEVVNVSLVVMSNIMPERDACLFGIDLSASNSPIEKSKLAVKDRVSIHSQEQQIANPDARLVLNEEANDQRLPPFAEFVECYQGLRTGDANRFLRCFWEQDNDSRIWSFFQTTSDLPEQITGLCCSLRWEKGSGQLHEYARETRHKLHDMHESGNRCWGKTGIAIGQMSLRATRYFGEHFDNTLSVMFPKNAEVLPAVAAYCFSKDYEEQVRRIAHGIYVTNQTLLKVPFDVKHWREVARQEFSEGLPAPVSEDPTQWIFSGSLLTSTAPLQVAVACLLGHKWPRQVGFSFMDCPAIDVGDLEQSAGQDGIVCLATVKGDPSARDRLIDLLAAAFGSDWSAAKLDSLLVGVGFASKSLDDWLKDGFFEQHCTLFQNRPFIWHIWDGRRDGFHALVNYHCLAAPDGEGRRMLEKLIYTYLGDWIDRQRADQKSGVEGSDARLAHAEHLRAELITILEGEPPYDIFVRWKTLRQQPIGWDPDINDGVRVNIRPFMTARPLGARAKNACILRATPNIKWKKDRGKEPMRNKEDYPWFWGWNEAASDFLGGSKFDDNRWNDLHYSNAFKRAARAWRAADPEANR